jgi:hypothetical protein
MGEDITKAKEEMNTNVTALTEHVDSLKKNALDVYTLAENYAGFKTELQTTLEKIITITDQLDTSNSKTQSDVQQKLVAYKNLLSDYQGKINVLKKGDFATLKTEINNIKNILTEEDSTRNKRNELLLKARTLIDKSTGSPTPQPSPSPPVSASPTTVNANSSTDAVSMLKESQAAIKRSQQAKENYNKKLNEYIGKLPSGTPTALDVAMTTLARETGQQKPTGWDKANFIDEGKKIAQDGRKKGGSRRTRRKPKKVRKSKKSKKTRRR